MSPFLSIIYYSACCLINTDGIESELLQSRPVFGIYVSGTIASYAVRTMKIKDTIVIIHNAHLNKAMTYHGLDWTEPE